MSTSTFTDRTGAKLKKKYKKTHTLTVIDIHTFKLNVCLCFSIRSLKKRRNLISYISMQNIIILVFIWNNTMSESRQNIRSVCKYLLNEESYIRIKTKKGLLIFRQCRTYLVINGKCIVCKNTESARSAQF